MASIVRVGLLWSVGLGVVGTILGGFCGVLYSVGGFVYDLTHGGPNAGTALAFLALIGMPMLFGATGAAAGFVLGAVGKAVTR